MGAYIKQEEVIAVVERLNDEWWKVMEKRTEQDYVHPFQFLTDGTSMAVTFLEAGIWNDENDLRPYNEEKDEFEPLDVFLRREVQAIGKDILEVFPF
jgi:hypothetical protein